MDSKLYELIDILIELIDDEFTLKGHPDTGQFQESLEGVIERKGPDIKVEIWGRDYGLYLSEGVPPERVPYTRRNRGQGRGGQSKYITGLYNWVQRKLGISDHREALSVAFAIAQRHSEEGYPIVNGELGSKFLEEVTEKHREKIDKLIEEFYDIQVRKFLKKDE